MKMETTLAFLTVPIFFAIGCFFGELIKKIPTKAK